MKTTLSAQDDNPIANDELKSVGILNLSDHFKVLRRHADLLKKGLTYVPSNRLTPWEQFQEGTDKFVRNLKLKFSYLNFKDSGTERFRVPSSYQPPQNTYPPELEELQIILNQEIRRMPRSAEVKSNLTPQDRLALKELKNNTDLVIKKADKGACIVLMDRKDYIYEAERQLKVARHYREIAQPQYPENCLIFNQILTEMKNLNLISGRELQYLRAQQDSRERILYLLPKIHKEKWTIPGRIPPGRPIVSDVNSESYAISRFIDFHLAPYATSHRSYVKNTYDFLDKLSRVQTNPEALLISLDVDSLYTNIDNDLGIAAVTKAFATQPKPIHKYIIQLLRLSLEGNDFIFNNRHYLQVSGTAMGKKFAPHYADITMACWENENLEKCDKQPRIYLRYLDDIFMIWEHPLEDFDQFFETLNGAHPNIKLKSNIQRQELEFLDVLVYKGEVFEKSGIFDTKVYFKPTDSHALLHKASFHPKHTFAGIIKSQLIRFGRICQLEVDFNEAADTLFRALYPRGYSRRFLRQIRNEVKIKFFPPDNLTGMIPCGSNRCTICTHINPSRTVSTGSTNFRLSANGNCRTEHAIYILNCKRCPTKYYVGQTSNLRNRIIAHLSSIRRGSDKLVHQHFRDDSHAPSDLLVSILEIPKNKKPENMDKLERDWILKLKSHRIGLNSDEGNAPPNICPYILQHHPVASKLNSLAQNWLEEFLEVHDKNKKKKLQIVRASARNKNLSQSLVRALLRDPETADDV